MQIVWTRQAQERQQQWQQRLEITRQEVETVLMNPQQVIVEDNVFVSQFRRGGSLLRVIFVEIGNNKRILTLYWTNQVNRYWQG
ncbi:hypothetical protein [Coleofasciculus chthonoplastes]|uniref:hypothetical protein n=1 Tax=Coleofasciculus chthonoplastes TaxID=64178 RepID=UPI0032F0A38C